MKQCRNNLLTIKEFSKLTHTTIDTLKHYDRIGILKPAYTSKITIATIVLNSPCC